MNNPDEDPRNNPQPPRFAELHPAIPIVALAVVGIVVGAIALVALTKGGEVNADLPFDSGVTISGKQVPLDPAPAKRLPRSR